MRSPARLLIIAALALALTPTVLAEAATGPGGTWGTAQPVPGLAALGAESAAINSVSCPSTGNCVAGGGYGTGAFVRAFVVDEVDGTWANARNVPGIKALSGGRNSEVDDVSCTSPGNCAATGTYQSKTRELVFVAEEVSGSWRRAMIIPGFAALVGGGSGEVERVACATPGNCAAGGTYFQGKVEKGYVASEVNGAWRKAQLVRPAKGGGYPTVASVSCGALGSCVAGGEDLTGVFAMTARDGVWLQPRFLGSGPVNGQVWSVSCAARGYCAVGGYFFDARERNQPFVVNQVNGIWGALNQLPGSAALNTGGDSEVLTVSCAAKTTCAAGGYYENRAKQSRPLVADEVNGSWGPVQHVLGLPAGDTAGWVDSIACGAPGDCVAGGSYDTAAGPRQAFVVNEVNGTWGKAIGVPGLSALNANGNAGVISISCPAAGNCVAGGYYEARALSQAFIAEEH